MQISTIEPPWRGHVTVDLGGQEVKGQGHICPSIIAIHRIKRTKVKPPYLPEKLISITYAP